MNVSPFSNLAPLSGSVLSSTGFNTIQIDYELVRGNEDRVQAELLSLVQRASIALDLSQVERIDAAGIASLITLYCTAIDSGNAFYVVDPSVRVLELLRLVGLDQILVADNTLTNSEPQLSDDAALQFSQSAA